MFPFRVIAHPTSDTQCPSLLLHTTSGKRYIFGSISEGTQRCLNEQKIKVSKLGALFLTGELSWRTVGGLPGLILTVSDQGKKDLDIVHSSPLLTYVVSTWRYFVFRFGMNLNARIIPNQQVYKDENMEVKTISLTSSDSSVSELDPETVEKLNAIVNNMFPLNVHANDPAKYDNDGNEIKLAGDPLQSDPHIHVRLPDIHPIDVSTSYSIQFNPVRGKFNPQKAQELGIPRGSLYSQLANGNDITLADGTVVKPQEVLSEGRVFQKLFVIDIPSQKYVDSAFKINWLENNEEASVVYHFLGKDVDPCAQTYVEFINSFGTGCQHYISHPLYCPNSISFKGCALTILKLRTLIKDHFDLPLSFEPVHSFQNKKNQKLLLQGQICNVECSVPSTKNKITINDSNVEIQGPKDWDDLFEKRVRPLGLVSSHSKEQILDPRSCSSEQVDPNIQFKDQVETITFGTGSALPSKYRNVISNLVRIPRRIGNEIEFRSILFDAGEDTIGSIRRMFGESRLPVYFNELQVIYLSHLHADHHLGIVSIIKEWFKHNEANSRKLYLITPWQYEHFIEEWSRVECNFNVFDRITYISCEDFLFGKPRDSIAQIGFEDFIPGSNMSADEKIPFKRNFAAIKELSNDVGIKKFLTCRAYHCPWAYSCSVVFHIDDDDIFKVSYSGDTRPNTYMFANNIGKDSDLLIHEATLENELVKEAKAKRHCTINEAIQVSNAMGARKLILTHFSQRYPRIPRISNNMVVDADYCFAFDSMIVKYNNIQKQKTIFKELEKAFREEELENDEEF